MDRKTVLLVDDDVDLTEANRLALEGAGYDVVVAHDGQEGFARATQQHVDMAILDVIMTRPDEGFDLARTLRNDTRTAGIPLLMLTSVNAANSARGLLFRLSDRDRDEMWLPVDRFVDKPVPPERLLGLVREIVH
jgi:CheY-like chemotaxis protein